MKLPTNKVSGICASLLISLFSGVIGTAATTLTIGQGTGDQETAGLVPVTLSSDVPVSAIQFDVQYDDTLLVAGSVLPGSLTTNQNVVFGQPTNGVQRVVIYSINNTPLPNGLLVNLQITAGFFAQDGIVSLTPTNVIASSAAAQRIAPVSLNSGSFLISTEAPAQFTSVTVQNGIVALQLTGRVGDVFALEASVNLIDWISLNTNSIPGGGVLNFTDSGPTSLKARFYRARQQ